MGRSQQTPQEQGQGIPIFLAPLVPGMVTGVTIPVLEGG